MELTSRIPGSCANASRSDSARIYKHTRQSKSGASIPLHVPVGRRKRELECARDSRALFNFLTLASNSVTRSRSAAHRNVTWEHLTCDSSALAIDDSD